MEESKINRGLGALMVLVFVGLLLLGRNFSYGSEHIFTSSKENMSLSFIEEFQQDGDFKIATPSMENEAIQTAFTPRDATQLNGDIVPQTFPGILLIFGLITSLTSFILPFLNPLVFILILFFYYKIVRRFFDDKVALLSTILLAAFPTFTYLGAKLISDDLLSLMFLLAGAYGFLIKRMPLAALLLGMAIFVRLANAVWVLPFVIFAIWKVKDKKFFPNFIVFGKSILMFLVLIVGMAFLNNWIYGSPLTTGYHLQYPIINGLVGTETGSFQAGLAELWFQIKNYLVLLYALPLTLSIFAIRDLYKKNRKNLLTLLAVILVLFLFLSYQYAGTIFWGHDHAALNSSFMRYVLPFYLVFPALMAYLLNRFSAKTRGIFVVVILLSFTATIISFRGGLREKWDQEAIGLELQNHVLEHTSEETLIFTNFQDKWLFPKRQTITIPLLRSQEAFGYQDVSPWVAPLDYSKIAEAMSYLESHKKNFVMLSDPKINMSRLQSELAKTGLYLKPKTPSTELFLIDKVQS